MLGLIHGNLHVISPIVRCHWALAVAVHAFMLGALLDFEFRWRQG